MDKTGLAEELHRLMESLLNGTLSDHEEQRLQDLLVQDGDARRFYLRYMDLHVGLMLSGRKRRGHTPPVEKPEAFPAEQDPSSPRSRRRMIAAALLASICLIGFVAVWNPGGNQPPVAAHPAVPQEESPGNGQPDQSHSVILSQDAGAIFFRDFTPRVGARLEWERDYSLLQGQVELLFPRGARVIFDSPAVFRLKSAEQVLVSFGNCSVYAPEGSEGFEVLTPSTQLIDRGTRFSVNVDESGRSDVHVVEGLVDAVNTPDNHPMRLSEGQARRYSRAETAISPSSDLRYSSASYRHHLPDRLVRFTGPLNEQGEIERLEEVQVMRRGQPHVYPFAELIGGDVTSFCELGSPVTANLILPREFNGHFRDLFLHDDSFLTGVLNPGGAKQPFQGRVLTPNETDDRSQWTPGMTVTFRTPVVNSPGPDILVFDAHTAVHPLAGDKFHIRPLELKPGYRPMTVQAYDIGMLSHESYPMTPFRLLQTKEPVARLDDLLEMQLWRSNISLNYRVVATGIDLSDMGVPEGESISAIFLQDVMDDEHRIDPVMFVGLPEIPPVNSR